MNMLKYISILLDSSSTSYCHYDNECATRSLLPLEELKVAIVFCMKQNLTIQFVYPDYELPQEYHDVIESIDHVKIMPADAALVADADVVVCNGCSQLDAVQNRQKIYILRTTKAELFAHVADVKSALSRCLRLNVVITDVDTFCDADYDTYKGVLQSLADELLILYASGRMPQLNLLTDRMMLDKMYNCGAGDTIITLAPDARFYVCPAFYYEKEDADFGSGPSRFSIGSLSEGVNIPNAQMYKLDHAPICRTCDAYQCKRCVWINRRLTYELNTPGHEQCVVAHLERNASRKLLEAIRRHSNFAPEISIPEIDYLDPFDNVNKYKF